MKPVLKFYISLPYIGAIHCHAGPSLYKKHLYSINKWNKETIIELPLAEFIFTPWQIVRAEKQPIDVTDKSDDGKIGQPDCNPDISRNP